MRSVTRTTAILGAVFLLGTAGATALADDGDKVLKSMSHTGNEEKYPGYDIENEHAFIGMMDFYVPTQAANGTVAGVSYYNVDEALVEIRYEAQPLVGVYLNGPVEHVDGVGFSGYGKRDAYAAVSLDDGMTWKNVNLSESADLASSDVIRKDVKLFKDTKSEYPGDVVNIFHAVAGDKVMVAWPSKFCSSGQPNYSLDAEEADARQQAIAGYLGITLDYQSYDDLYLTDMFRVAGKQGSVDYTEDKWEQNHVVGEVPYSCVWTARGQLVDGDDPRTDEVVEESYMRWFKAERLTSGRRDANRIEVRGVEGAGFAITWQEDPDGLRPGQGEGPGEGWSGAIGNSGTDIWYSYIDWEHFDVVQDPADDSGVTPMTFDAYTDASFGDITQKPKPYVPMAMPMPLTDNAKCNVDNPAPYCYGSALQTGDPGDPGVTVPADSQGNALDPLAMGMKDMCADTVSIESGKGGHDDTITEPVYTDVCVPESGTPLVGNTASTRARISLFGYDVDADGIDDNAFVVMQTEEDKGLGRATFLDSDADGLPDGIETGAMTTCEPVEGDRTCIAWDIGKNQRYHTFAMSLTDDTLMSAFPEDSLVQNLTFTGHMLNQPEVDWRYGAFFPTLNTSEIWHFVGDGGDYNFELYNTEIARRGSLLAQGIGAAAGSVNNLLALPTWKQGQMNQGGPADVMSRRIVLPTDTWSVDQGNPYAFRNMACETYADFGGVENPYYPGGVCLDSAINWSGTIPDSGVDSQSGATDVLPILTENGDTGFVSSDTNPILRGLVQGEGDTTKLLTWHQAPYDAGETSDTDRDTTDDQSWENPFEVAKGHRGFLDGDFVMMLYAWSPNWRLNTVGHDRYELYIRRSFDGGLTFTTLPGSFAASDGEAHSGDGSVSCETYRTQEQQQQGDSLEPRVCYDYGAGAAEQARNVTQHTSMRITTLDPRYSKTTATLVEEDPFETGHIFGDEDVRDPSRYFIVYETGDNTTTAEGEPEPLDLFYSRAVNFGDDYAVWAEETDLSVCYPSEPYDQDVPEALVGSGFCNEFDQLEQGRPGVEASEASVTSNPGGEFLYAAWAQLEIDDSKVKVDNNKNKDTTKKDKTEVVGSDAMFRRVWFIDDYISATDAWTFGQGPNGDG